jgi:hypothetical protein
MNELPLFLEYDDKWFNVNPHPGVILIAGVGWKL